MPACDPLVYMNLSSRVRLDIQSLVHLFELNTRRKKFISTRGHVISSMNPALIKKWYPDPDFHTFFIIEKRGGFYEFVVNVYIHRTKKLYPDPNFGKFNYP